MLRFTKFLAALCIIAILSGCAQNIATTPGKPPVTLKHFAMDSTDGLISLTNTSVDRETSVDGNGSIKIDVKEAKTIPLFEVKNPGTDNAILLYQAKLKTEDFKGKVYMEMLCHFDGKGEFFSRALQSPLSGTMDWTSQETPFMLEKGQKPDYIKLNLVAEGTGTVWVDDIHLKETSQE